MYLKRVPQCDRETIVNLCLLPLTYTLLCDSPEPIQRQLAKGSSVTNRLGTSSAKLYFQLGPPLALSLLRVPSLTLVSQGVPGITESLVREGDRPAACKGSPIYKYGYRYVKWTRAGGRMSGGMGQQIDRKPFDKYPDLPNAFTRLACVSGQWPQGIREE